jgi:single-strand DNA-binding protein
MSLNLNTVMLAGHLTRDPQLRSLANDRTVVSFSLAINRRFKGADGEVKEDSTFVDCEAWGRTAELVGQYLAKGSACYIEGRLKLDSWEDKEGGKRSRLKVVADSVQFLGKPKAKSAEGGEAPSTSEAPASHEAPASAAASPRASESAPATALYDQPPF